jgi:predicted DNA-binding transcriptional regulator AlpA
MDEAFTDQDFYTDKQLQRRWHCSHMKLYRLREDGILPPPIKIGGRGSNLTAAEHVKQLEQTPVTEDAA